MYYQIDKIAISPNLSGMSRNLRDYTNAFTKITDIFGPKELHYIKNLKNNDIRRED